MPKLKTHSSAKKRIKTTSTGKLKHRRPGRNHFLSKKGKGRKRQFTKEFTLTGGNHSNITKMLKGHKK